LDDLRSGDQAAVIKRQHFVGSDGSVKWSAYQNAFVERIDFDPNGMSRLRPVDAIPQRLNLLADLVGLGAEVVEIQAGRSGDHRPVLSHVHAIYRWTSYCSRYLGDGPGGRRSVVVLCPEDGAFLDDVQMVISHKRRTVGEHESGGHPLRVVVQLQ